MRDDSPSNDSRTVAATLSPVPPGLKLETPGRKSAGGRYLRAVQRSCQIGGNALEVLLKGCLVITVTSQLALVLLAVFGRYFFSWSPPALEEIAGYLFVWTVMLGTPVAMRHAELGTVEVLYKYVPKAEAAFRLFASLLSGLFFLFAVVSGWQLIGGSMQIASPGSGIPLGYAYAGVFVSGVFGCAFTVEVLVKQFKWDRQVVAGLIGFAACASGVILLGTVMPSIQGALVIVVALGILAIALAVGVPIPIALGLSAFLALRSSGTLPLEIVAQRMADGLDNFVLLAVPFFLLAGTMMAHTSLAARLLGLAKSITGHRTGGLAGADILASVVFADMSGSAIADTAALGTVVIPELRRAGYSGGSAAAVQASAGALGIMFPPSITMIIYSSVANVSVIKAFLSLVVPGVCLTASYLALAYLRARRLGIDRGMRLPGHARLRLAAPGLPVLVVPGIILGGIFSGIVTPAESGSLAVLATLLLSVLAYRETSLRGLGSVCIESSLVVARVGMIIASATALGWIVTVFNGPQAILNLLVAHVHNAIAVLLLIGAALVLIHMVMDAAATMLVVTPLLLPVFASLNINLLHFGVLLNVTSAAGLLIPPLGFNVLIASRIAGVSLGETTRAAIPYFVITLAFAVLIVIFPGLSTYLPNHF